MAEFHIGDKVSVLYQGKPIGGVVEDVRRALIGKAVYKVSGLFWPEEMLDYDQSDDQKNWWANVERIVHDLLVAAKDAENIVHEAEARGIHCQRLLWLAQQIAEVRRLLNP